MLGGFVNARLRLTFTRNEVCSLLDALENLIEDYQHDVGTALVEDEIRLKNKLRDWLRDYDVAGRRAA